jgi:Protein of unknown function (DUF3052)
MLPPASARYPHCIVDGPPCRQYSAPGERNTTYHHPGSRRPPGKEPPIPERNYGHRDVIDKLGIKPAHRVACDEEAWVLDAELRQKVLDRVGDFAGASAGPIDVVLVTTDATTDGAALLRKWRPALHPAGGIWLLTPKRGRPGYVNQNDLIEEGKEAGVVDNKVCSVSETVSAMRFVIRREDR